jgi:hypothetical protein
MVDTITCAESGLRAMEDPGSSRIRIHPTIVSNLLTRKSALGLIIQGAMLERTLQELQNVPDPEFRHTSAMDRNLLPPLLHPGLTSNDVIQSYTQQRAAVPPRRTGNRIPPATGTSQALGGR